MLQKLFEDQRRYLNHFFDRIDLKKMEEVYQLCLNCSGLMIFTGVGKSGIIAEKIAMTLTSTGTRALYLPSMNFLHGDIGIVSEHDLVFLLSKSGETEELLNLIPFLKRRKAKIVGVVSQDHNRLARAADMTMVLPIEKELCPFNLAPTTSTTTQLMFGDALAIALMQAKQFKLDEYALTHPSGAIGKKMTLLVEDIMLHGESLPVAHPNQLLKDVLVELSNKKCGCLLILNEDNQLLGIFTDGDLRRALQSRGSQVLDEPMEKLMTHSAISVSKQCLAWEAMQIMQADPKKWIMMCPVLEGERVVGIIRMHDIIHSGLA
jgi:arabinose-5-phosphate isomerase